MHPFVNTERRLIFWWTAKCGCTTVKSIMIERMVLDYVSSRMASDESAVRSSLDRILYNKTGPDGGRLDSLVSDFLGRQRIFSAHPLHAGAGFRVPLEMASEFKNILFVRDPFKRFVSGVLDKHIEGNFSHLFRPASFLDAARNIGLLDRHHFARQTGDAYLPSLSYDRVFDIESIDYEFLSGLLGMKVEPRVMHRNREFSGDCPPNLAEATYKQLFEIKSSGSLPRYDCFYNDESRAMVKRHYRDDFDLMRLSSPSAS
jgi:hypothetical protein